MHLLQPEANALGVALVHVDHGLQTQSARWVLHCQSIAAHAAYPLHVLRVQVKNHGEGLEAAARKARYRAIAKHFEPSVLLLTAHHQDDQAETVLMKLLSGAGTRGSVGMAALKAHSGLLIARPLLGVTRGAIKDYAEAHALRWIEDPSNQNTDFRRNHLRALLPQLHGAFPDLSHTLSLFAEQAQQDRRVLEHAANAALARVQSLDPQVLRINDLRAESVDLQDWIVRAWLARMGVFQARHWRAALALALASSETGEVKLPAEQGSHTIRRFDQCLYFCAKGCEFKTPTQCWDGKSSCEIFDEQHKIIGQLHFSGDYVPAQSWHWIVSQRTGGERLLLPGAAHHTTLKTLFQHLRVPPWQRNSMILLRFSDTNELAWVGGIAASARFHALCAKQNIRLHLTVDA